MSPLQPDKWRLVMNNQESRHSRVPWLAYCLALSLTCGLAGCGSDELRNPPVTNSPAGMKSALDRASTAPDPADDMPLTNLGNDGPADEQFASCRRWPIPDSGARVEGVRTIAELESEYRMGRKETDAKYSGRLLEL